MAKIITYKNEGARGVFCQLQLDSGERILISIAQSGVKIFKLGFMGVFPMKTIWESSSVEKMVKIFVNSQTQDMSPLDAVIKKLENCKNIEQILEKINQISADESLQNIETIVHEYGILQQKVAQEIKSMYPAAVFPKSILPYPKERIRKALENAIYLTDDNQMIENLKGCMAFLEGFIDDEEANKKNASLLKILKK
ncbi:MAG: hypothetical protein A2Y67_00580 [Candidatus Buchananbacteria bacterium RBG_13_39_9]|uniref:Uncharacterized protein n=1 Tax=Candidatus Buchananbacteria bacterium RBG_13_39_9 TaxID=1797531 RepID=A0A1G1XNR2_9BACT|nr:MAG: hypothetical protein A2Y67_00580 [Candidatus Buchananbacteria bacterium RBG_13_39_9]